jgi:hypothetical protein
MNSQARGLFGHEGVSFSRAAAVAAACLGGRSPGSRQKGRRWERGFAEEGVVP